MGEVHEECGIAAVNSGKKEESAALLLYNLLLQQQNRGQLSAGITTFDNSKKMLLDTFRETGLVNEVFRANRPEKFKSIIKNFSGEKGIGHVRYATFGGMDRAFAQPFERKHGKKWKWFSFGFNGNITNFSEAKKQLEENKFHFILDNDTELLMHFLAKGSEGDKKTRLVDVFSKMSELDGAYSIAFINAEGETAVARDPLGFKPIVVGKKDNLVAAASESAALEKIGIEKFESVKPGAIVEISNSGEIETKWFCKSNKKSHCMFEWVYFANIASEIENRGVYAARYALGEELAKLETEKTTEESIVVPVPDTAKPAGDALAFSLGIPSKEGLIRNRYVGRTFIEGQNRAERAKEKYTVNKDILKGKKVFLVEDSIVRGTTTKAIVKYIKETGKAKEVHVRVSCPPIRFPCFYGIDMSTFGELIASPEKSSDLENIQVELSEKETNKIKDFIEADSLIYQSIDGLVKGIALESGEKDLCMACLNGKYPTCGGEKLKQIAFENFKKGGIKRTYEQC